MDLLIKKKLVGRISLLSSFQSTHEFKTHFSFTPFVALWFPFTIRKFKVVQGTSAMTISTIWWRYLLLTLHGVLAHQWSRNTFLSLIINDFPLFPRSLFEWLSDFGAVQSAAEAHFRDDDCTAPCPTPSSEPGLGKIKTDCTVKDSPQPGCAHISPSFRLVTSIRTGIFVGVLLVLYQKRQ